MPICSHRWVNLSALLYVCHQFSSSLPPERHEQWFGWCFTFRKACQRTNMLSIGRLLFLHVLMFSLHDLQVPKTSADSAGNLKNAWNKSTTYVLILQYVMSVPYKTNKSWQSHPSTSDLTGVTSINPVRNSQPNSRPQWLFLRFDRIFTGQNSFRGLKSTLTKLGFWTSDFGFCLGCLGKIYENIQITID